MTCTSRARLADALLAKAPPAEPAQEAAVQERIDPHLGPGVEHPPLQQESEEALQPQASSAAAPGSMASGSAAAGSVESGSGAPGSVAPAASLPDTKINYVAEIRAVRAAVAHRYLDEWRFMVSGGRNAASRF